MDEANLRAIFERRFSPSWNMKTKIDSLGNRVYVRQWVQGAWVGFRFAMGLKNGPNE